ncbi:MAG TPA: Asp-tRNA(Asn)/Glu-tRNA(Gln) amidotransferase GatCAB subunit B, partial [Thermoanaerobaculia bacterium]|nr:Asp-tRNA(Asn)/Glu-tRNA(Gln) amidotransferase GatCAB subunit B [Thermoanaerobaculia bacterium]
RVVQETRSFDADSGLTRLLRSKEEAHDYRYFPEPDLPPLILAAERIVALQAALPELPWQRRARFASQYGLPAGDAQVLTTARELADYYEAAAAALPANPKGIANWVMGEVLRDVKERKVELAGTIAPERLAALVALVDAGRISNSAAKEVFAAVAATGPLGEDPAAAVERLGLGQVSDTSQIEGWIEEVVEQNAGPVAQYRAGKTQTIGFLVGQVMKRSGGRAEPKTVQQLLKQALEREPVA